MTSSANDFNFLEKGANSALFLCAHMIRMAAVVAIKRWI